MCIRDSSMPMPLENLATLLRKHPTAVISKIDHANNSIFFTERNRQWVMVFLGTAIAGVWDMTGVGGDNWDERAQDQQEAVGF